MLEGDIYNNFGGETENFNEFDPGDTQPEVDSFEDLDPFEYDVDAPSLSRKRKINQRAFLEICVDLCLKDCI